MELYKRAKTKNYFEIFIFILLCLSVLYLIFQILISTGFAIDGGVISDNKGEQITSGSDVIYLGSFEEKTETTKIFLPRNVESGIYQFFVQVSHDSYVVSSHRTIELEVSEDVATFGPTEEPKVSIPLIIIILILLFLLSGGRLQKHKREKAERKGSELGRLITSFEKKVGQKILLKKHEKYLPERRSNATRIDENIKQIDKADVLSRIKEQTFQQPFYKTTVKSELDLIEEAVKKTEEKERIEKAVEETKKKNKDRKNTDELLEDLKKKDKTEEKKNITDDEYYDSLFKD